MKMKNIIKFAGIVAGIVAASVVIDKLIDKAYEGVEEEHEDYADVEEGKFIDVDVSASTCKPALLY